MDAAQVGLADAEPAVEAVDRRRCRAHACRTSACPRAVWRPPQNRRQNPTAAAHVEAFADPGGKGRSSHRRMWAAEPARLSAAWETAEGAICQVGASGYGQNCIDAYLWSNSAGDESHCSAMAGNHLARRTGATTPLCSRRPAAGGPTSSPAWMAVPPTAFSGALPAPETGVVRCAARTGRCGARRRGHRPDLIHYLQQ